MNELKIFKCPVCGKDFVHNPSSIYRLVIKQKINWYCSYTCYRNVQKELEHNDRNRTSKYNKYEGLGDK